MVSEMNPQVVYIVGYTAILVREIDHGKVLISSYILHIAIFSHINIYRLLFLKLRGP